MKLLSRSMKSTQKKLRKRKKRRDKNKENGVKWNIKGIMSSMPKALIILIFSEKRKEELINKHH